MHDTIMSQSGKDQVLFHDYERGLVQDGWSGIDEYTPSQLQTASQTAFDYTYVQPFSHPIPDEEYSRMTSTSQMQAGHHQIMPTIVPSQSTWPSMLTHPSPATYQPPPQLLPLPPSQTQHPQLAPAPLAPATTLPAQSQPVRVAPVQGQSQGGPRKTLTDADRRRMCEYHEKNPSIKQTEIGALFGVERSTVSKVLRQKEKYLTPDDRSTSPAKRIKGKHPDIDRALLVWVRNRQKRGIPIEDEELQSRAQVFSMTVGNGDTPFKANSTAWLEKFKMKNGLTGSKLTRRASETSVTQDRHSNSESSSLAGSATPAGVSSSSPSSELSSPMILNASKSVENMRSDRSDGYFEGLDDVEDYKHTNAQSSASLSSAFTDGAPASPPTPFWHSPETTCSTFMPSQLSRMSTPNSYQRPRSQTFPALGIDPTYIASTATGSEDVQEQKYQPLTAPSSAVEYSGCDDMLPPYNINTSVSTGMPALGLRRHDSHSSMVYPDTPALMQSPPYGSSPTSPTHDDACRAIDTLLQFITSTPQTYDNEAYTTIVKLTERLRLQTMAGHDQLTISFKPESHLVHIAPKPEQHATIG